MEDAAARSQVQSSPEVVALFHLSQGLCLWSADGCLTYCNPAFAECLGLEISTLRGLSVQALLDRAQRHGTLISWGLAGVTQSP